MPKITAGELKVLVVDDSPLSRALMRDMLNKSGFSHIDEAESAASAYEKMDAPGYDVVFLDWVMPGRSGVSLMEEWREDRRYDDVAVCIVSMQNDKEMIAGALKSGALSYIVKPVTEDMLKRTIEKIINWVDLRREFRDKKNT